MEEIVADKSSSDVKETSGKNASPSLSSDFLNTSAIDIVPAKSCNDVQETDDNGSPSETAESVECKNCPEAITEYLQHFTYQAERRKTLLELTTNARKQLLSTGWQIRSEMRKGSLQATFTFPEKIGYYSLEEACLGCFSDKQNCPEAITKYRRFLLTSHSTERKSLSVLSSNAQRYLSSAGWTIFYKSKPRNRFGKKIPDRFTSPQWKNYFSLLQACKAVRDDAAPQQSSKPANSEPKRRMILDGTSSKGFSSSHEDVNDEFFNVLKDFQQHEVAQGGGEPSKEDDNVPEVSPNCQVSASSEDESEEDSHEHREKKTNSVDDFVYHPEAADELLLDPSWLPPPPAMLSEAMDLQHTSANQMAALILYTTRMLAQKASSSRLSSSRLIDQEKMESQAARIASLEAANSTLLSERAELSKTVDDLKRELGEAEEVKKKEIREAEEAAVSKFVGSNRMTSWVNYYNTYRATLILQMVRAQTGAMGLEDFQLDMDDRLGFPVHPPPYEHPRPGTFADDGDHPIDAWEISELKTKTVLAEGVSATALPNPCALFKTLSASGTKRKAADEEIFSKPRDGSEVGNPIYPWTEIRRHYPWRGRGKNSTPAQGWGRGRV